ncbi:NAD(P)-dependent oxidoreductase [Solwaraspora sp. WMMD791]|uniref:NAD-dependent epimerase/dehydratase family protein n=1 Tax=Solwaraspora sp. WMMD791 TaxID=3016086 RepID=UPI00249B07E2|nr:NAD(P)-dependent oxidoreductase [Solwaraspora sp. WMMD791]WFE30110.1 NAD(P)-dependent oxidoreductase [Solwaraspora sp. WMMD791]
MKAFVVGGTGLLGRHLVPMLIEEGHRVTVMSPGDRWGWLPDEVDRVRASLVAPGTPELLRTRLAGHDVVVNLASAVPADPTAPGAWQLNTQLRRDGTRVLLDAVRDIGVRRLVQMSISMVYADGGDRWLDESAPFDPDPARAGLVDPVVAMESAVTRHRPDELAWTVLRGGRFVGPGTLQDAQVAALRAGRLPVAGDGRSFVSMVHVRDYAAAVSAAVRAGAAGLVCNVCADPVRVADYLDTVARLVGAGRPRRDPAGRSELPSQRVSSARARCELGWRPRHGIWPTPAK